MTELPLKADGGTATATEPRQARSAGHGAIRHTPFTRRRVAEMVGALGEGGRGSGAWQILHAADRVASAAMWLVVHETYARNVYLDGRALKPDDFKPVPRRCDRRTEEP